MSKMTPRMLASVSEWQCQFGTRVFQKNVRTGDNGGFSFQVFLEASSLGTSWDSFDGHSEETVPPQSCSTSAHIILVGV